MNADQLLELYDRVAESPDAIPRLRRFVLDLAVRGKLVEQDAADEPASELVIRISKEKAEILKRGGEKRSNFPSEDDQIEFGFPIPSTWEWVPATFPAIGLSDLGKKIQTKDVKETGAFPVVDQGKVAVRGFCDDADKVLRLDSPIILFGDHTRETKYIDFDFVVGADGVKLLQPIGIYDLYYFLSLQWLPLESRGYGRHFKMLKAAHIPLPPLAEQHRIVAKVDELMALLERLEQARAGREALRDQLTAATLNRLTQTDPEDFQPASHFALQTLPHLTTRPDQIKTLRQTILNLAVRGKLVEQDAADEPAADLLKRIAKVRGAKAKLKLIRRNGEQELSALNADHSLPSGWVWTDVDELALSMRYGTSIKCEYGTEGAPVLRIPNVSGGSISLENMKFGPLSPSEICDLSLLAGDILLIRSNGSLDIVGRSAVVTPGAAGMAFAGYLVRLRLSLENVSPTYLWLVLNSSDIRDQIEKPIRSAVGLKNVNLTEFGALTIPLPPLAEQHRIVARVDALMALCDQLEAGLSGAEATRTRLLDALLHAALQPATDLAEAAERASPAP